MLHEKRKDIAHKKGEKQNRYIKLSKRKNCGHHNYYILNDVIVPIAAFLQECKIKTNSSTNKRPYWADPSDNIETSKLENDVFYDC